MQAKNVLYAAVGVPVVAARRVGTRFSEIRAKLTEEAGDLGKAAEKAIDGWAAEGERLVGRISESKAIDELTAKVDFEQAKEQVTKLRDQLEDMLATWRSSFRPERAEPKSVQPSDVVEKEPSASSTEPTTTKAPSTKSKASAAKTPSSAAKKSSAKPPAAKKAAEAS